MSDITGAPSSSTMLRWTSLIVIAANMAFIAVYNTLSETPTIAELAAGYGDVFVPAVFARGIGAVMLIAFLTFYVAALWPSNRRRRTYDKLVVPLVLTSVMASGWIVAFRHEKIALSVAMLVAIVALAGVMFTRVAAASPGKYSHWLRVPFSLHFAAMSVALMVALTQWLNVGGAGAGTAAAPDVVAIALLGIAAATGGFVAFRYNDFVYPAVIASATGAMFVAQHLIRPDVAFNALTVCVGMLVVAGLALVALARQPRSEPRVRSSRSGARFARRAPDEGWYPMEGTVSVIRF